MSEHIELTEPCGVLTVPGVREYVCRLEPVGDDANVHINAPLEPIVRCRDCAYWATEERFTGMCVGKQFNPDGFCAWAKRRDA